MTSTKVMVRSIIVNILLSIIKFIIGFITNSQAIVSEGVDSGMDSINNLIALFAIKKSHDPADDDHPLGHGKLEYVASLLLSVIIMSIGFALISNIVTGSKQEVVIPKTSSLIAIVFTTGITVMLAMYLIKAGKRLNNQLISALGKENLSDILKSSIAFIGIILSIISRKVDLPFLEYGDAIAGVIIGSFIIINGFGILRESVDNILGRNADSETIMKYKELISTVNDVKRVKWIDVIKHGPFYTIFAEVLVDENYTVRQAHDITIEIESLLKRSEEISYVSIHVEPFEED